MATKKTNGTLKVGDRVRVLNLTEASGRIVELRGSLGPGGAEIDRVRLGRKPRATYIELSADQLQLIPAKRE